MKLLLTIALFAAGEISFAGTIITKPLILHLSMFTGADSLAVHCQIGQYLLTNRKFAN